MAVTIQSGEHGWGKVTRPFANLFRSAAWRGFADRLRKAVRGHARRSRQPLNLWANGPRVQEAILAVRMAANPGEDYSEVSERIEQEAKRYREFLSNPTPIGKITLNAKYVLLSAAASDIAGGVCQVRDPAKGHAHFLYSFKRSADLVLEFLLHDQHDALLFPIVRTYSDWLGKRTFDLGAGRTFDLKMFQGECPEFVRVEASFTNARAAATTRSGECVATYGLPLAADQEDNGGKARPTSAASLWPYRSPFALALGFQLMVLFAVGWTFWRQPPNVPPGAGLDKHAAVHFGESVAARRSAVFTIYTGEAVAGLDDANISTPNKVTPFRWLEAAYRKYSTDVAAKAQQQNEIRRRVTRIAVVAGGRVKMDDNFCRQVGKLCDGWRADIQTKLDTVHVLLERPTNATKVSSSSQRPQPMLLSYLNEGVDSGHVHVTLLTDSALYLVRGTGCMEFDAGTMKGFADANTNAPIGAGSDLCGGNEASEQPEGGSTRAAEEGVKSSNAE